MTVMLCRNRVTDFSKWKTVFDTNLPAAADAGLRLTSLWQDIADANNVFFIFQVESIDRARTFTEDPAAAKAGEKSGVLDGEYHFLTESPV